MRLITKLTEYSRIKYQYDENKVYDKDELCIYGDVIYCSTHSGNLGNNPMNPLHWYSIAAFVTNSIGDPSGSLTATVDGETNSMVVNTVDGQKYIVARIV